MSAISYDHHRYIENHFRIAFADHCDPNRLLYRAIRKHGREAFVWKILCECYSKEDLDNAEIFFISYYGGPKNTTYNITSGGDGHNAPHSEATKGKISEKRKLKFTREQEVFIGQSFETSKQITQVIRDFKKHFGKKISGKPIRRLLIETNVIDASENRAKITFSDDDKHQLKRLYQETKRIDVTLKLFNKQNSTNISPATLRKLMPDTFKPIKISYEKRQNTIPRDMIIRARKMRNEGYSLRSIHELFCSCGLNTNFSFIRKLTM